MNVDSEQLALLFSFSVFLSSAIPVVNSALSAL